MADDPFKDDMDRVKPEPGAGEDGDPGLHSVPFPPASHVKPEPEDESDDDDNDDKDNDEQSVSETSYIEQLVLKTSVEELEAGVKIGLQLLESLKIPLNSAMVAEDNQVTQAGDWLKSIQQLQDSAKPVRTVVGVVGNTGAGKSSTINALLDEERLVPTNGMRACTASATEISYNYSDDPSQLYRAEIEFITAADWSQELNTLLEDLLDGSGHVSSDCTNPETDAGLAYSKIKAVYPQKTRDMIAESTPASLAREPAVRGVLGSVKRLKERTSAALFQGLQHYVDSKEKTAGSEKLMEFWPLIKVVRIYCKASALSTGAVVVDLPGVQDSNAARAAVAESYMKVCTGLWITAAIQRAVDDKTAKKLLGDSFKRQLKYDGQYSSVTFICTKTDDILESEVSHSLNLDVEQSETWEQITELRTQLQEHKVELGELKDKKAAMVALAEELDVKTEKWEDLLARLTRGQTVYRPSDHGKRKRDSGPCGQRKKRSFSGSDSDSDDTYDSDGSTSDKENGQPLPAEEDRTPLTEDEIETELVEFKSKKKDIRNAKKPIIERIAEVRKQMADISAKEKSLKSENKSVCIKARNEYSRAAIKNDFALGIKELDQEAAIEEDEDHFNPEEDVRDYEEVAQKLPVFCVSARAYQKLSGRLRKDAVHIDGFHSTDDTEIPQLQEHTRKLTEGGRISNCRRFLNELSQLLNSMMLWATNDGLVAPNKGNQKLDEKFLQARLTSLKKDLHAAVDDCNATFKDALTDHLYDTFDRLIPTSSANAVPTATAWGAHRNLGGMFWATYKATCRRFGVFAGASGPKDLNAELFEPISKHLAGAWEKVFQRQIPSSLDTFIRDVQGILKTFHQTATSGVQDPGRNPAGVNMLNSQLRAELTILADILTPLRALVTEKQRDANREFTPIIQKAMTGAYTVCINERGMGSYARMKAAMQAHVEAARHSMFQDATDHVKGLLDAMCQDMQKITTDHVDGVVEKLGRDYTAILVGADARTACRISFAESMVRKEVIQPLDKADSWFATLFPDEEVASGDAPACSPQFGSDGALEDLVAIAQQLERCHESPAASSGTLKAEPNF